MGDAHPVLVWLLSPTAKAAAQRALARLRLPEHLVDDVLQEAAIKALGMAARHEGAEPNSIEAVARRCIHLAAGDLHRRRGRRVATTALDEGAPPAPPEAPPPVLDLEDDCRRLAVAAVAADAKVGSAVLHELTFRLHPGVPIPAAAPTPAAGATDGQRTAWAALWLAGWDDCFAARGEDQAMRKRRARALEKVEVALGAAVRGAHALAVER